MKVTKWFFPPTKPVRNGWYECGSCIGMRHYYKDGKWYAQKYSSIPFTVFNFGWRGILK